MGYSFQLAAMVLLYAPSLRQGILPLPQDRVVGLWSRGGRAWTFGGYGHENSSAPHPTLRQDSTYYGLCYTSRGALARTRNSSMCSPCGIDPTTHRIMSGHSTTELHLALVLIGGDYSHTHFHWRFRCGFVNRDKFINMSISSNVSGLFRWNIFVK